MGPLIVDRDADGLPAVPAIRTCLRLLAQRGAKLTLLAAGAAVEIPRKGSDVAVAWIDVEHIPTLVAADWLIEISEGRFILSSSGRSIVRLMKAGPSPTEAGAGSSGAPPPPPGTPTIAPPTAPDSPLAWLRARRQKDGTPLLSDEAFTAGERLAEDFYRAQLSPRVTVDWDAIARTGDERRGMAGIERERGCGVSAAQARVRRALAAVPPELSGLLMDVCCFGRGLQEAERSNRMPQRSAHFIIDVALKMLARHYGLLPPADGTWQPRHRPHHWGSDDYRPTVDGG